MASAIHSIKGIFTDFLEDAEKECFLIPAYQRGYKWTSLGDQSQVATLMRDIYNSYRLTKGDKYYLQFITLKENGKTFEVIDGQQRLTTLTILLCILGKLTGLDTDFVVGKLHYETRTNFIKSFVYEDIGAVLNSASWDDFISSNAVALEDIDNQDVYYIYHAAKKIEDFLENIEKTEINSLYSYICDDVLIIANPLSVEMNSEKIFINVNKGVKLEDEDLVKGLIITRLPLDANTASYRLTENEIHEVRSNIGRQWDGLTSWSAKKEVIDYYKGDAESDSRIEWLIRLAFPDIKKVTANNPMFEYFDQECRNNKQASTRVFLRIRETMLRLDDWHSMPEVTNLLGYVLHARKGKGIYSILESIGEVNTRSELLYKLKTICKEILPIDTTSNKLRELNYQEHAGDIYNVFLMLDVAKFLPIGERKEGIYDFGKISTESWSIEHIFPQSTQDFKNLANLGSDDVGIILQLLPSEVSELSIDDEDKKTEIVAFFEKLKSSASGCSMAGDERELLGYILIKNAPYLHRLGNLCLLQACINSSLSNHYFDNKRKIISKKVSDGAFVPYHTYDVFSKLIIPTSKSLQVWSKDDIEEHENYINNEITAIINYLG